MKKWVSLLLGLFLLLAGVGTVCATPQTPSPSPTQPPSSDKGGQKDNLFIPDWAENLMRKVDSLMQTFEDLMSGKLLFDSVTSFVVMLVDEFLDPLYTVFEKSYLFTPRVAEIEFVYDSWQFFMVIGAVLMLLALVVIGYQISRGKKEMSSLLTVFLVSFLVLIFSLTLFNMVNVGVNWAVQEGLTNVLETEDADGSDRIDYQSLSGQDVLKASVLGVTAVTDKSYQGKTTGEIIAQTEGGIWTLLGVTVFIVLPLWLVSVGKAILLVILAIFFPLWILVSAYEGRYEPMYGWVNLYLRSLIVGVVIATHWGWTVKAQENYGNGLGLGAAIGVSPIWASFLAVAVMLLLFYFFWLRPIFHAVKDPVTLGGGIAVEQVGQWGVRASEIMNGVSKRLGLEDLQEQSLNFRSKSERMKEAGRRMQQNQGKSFGESQLASKLTGGLSEEIAGIRYLEKPIEWTNEIGTVVRQEQMGLGFAEALFAGVEKHQISLALQKRGFRFGGLLDVADEGQRDLISGLVRSPGFDERFGDAIHWNEHTGRMVLQPSKSNEVLRELESHGVDTTTLRRALQKDGMYFDLQSEQIGTLGKTDEFKSLLGDINEKSVPVYRPLELSPTDARRAYTELVQQSPSWLGRVRFDEDTQQLLVPLDLTAEVQQKLRPHLKSAKVYERIDLPAGSRFIHQLEQFLLNSSGPGSAWIPHLQFDAGSNSVYVPNELRGAFLERYDEFRKGRRPYWRKQDGRVVTIEEGRPVEYGQGAPINGIDMGSFEELQKRTLQEHRSGG